jgi:hypothetical protein
MLLKLKDWPPSTDIAEYMPKRFNNLFDSFPMPGKFEIDCILCVGVVLFWLFLNNHNVIVMFFFRKKVKICFRLISVLWHCDHIKTINKIEFLAALSNLVAIRLMRRQGILMWDRYVFKIDLLLVKTLHFSRIMSKVATKLFSPQLCRQREYGWTPQP